MPLNEVHVSNETNAFQMLFLPLAFGPISIIPESTALCSTTLQCCTLLAKLTFYLPSHLLGGEKQLRLSVLLKDPSTLMIGQDSNPHSKDTAYGREFIWVSQSPVVHMHVSHLHMYTDTAHVIMCNDGLAVVELWGQGCPHNCVKVWLHRSCGDILMSP